VKFTSSVYHVNFRLFNKVDVVGDTASPLWAFLKGIIFVHCIYLFISVHIFLAQICPSKVI